MATQRAHTSKNTRAPKESLRILYMHGLEAGPKGHKPTRLRKYYTEVHAPLMDLKAWRRPTQNPWVAGIAAAIVTTTPVALFSLHKVYRGLVLQDLPPGDCWRPSAFNLSLSLAICGAGCAYMYRQAVRHVVERCLSVQAAAIREHRPDVVVGSSFGGAMAVLSLVRGAYHLPTVVLAPAQDLVCQRTGITHPTREDIKSSNCGVVVAHGTQDTVVPLAHTKALFEAQPNVHVHCVDDIHPLSSVVAESPDGTPPLLVQYITEAMEVHRRLNPQ